MTQQEIYAAIDAATEELRDLSEKWKDERNLPFPVFWLRVKLHELRMNLIKQIGG